MSAYSSQRKRAYYAASKAIPEKRERAREWQKVYVARPEVKARRAKRRDELKSDPKHRERIRNWHRAHRLKPEVRERHRTYRKKYRSRPITLHQRMERNLRARVKTAIVSYKRNGFEKPGSAVRDLGCTIPEFIAYIEAQFQGDMTWSNWSFRGWHLDHKRPLISFDLADRAQFLQACHYTNYQPLWAFDNLSKGCRL